MSDVLEATRDYLLTQASVTNLVSQRVYFDYLPQGATLPAVVIELGSRDFERTLSGVRSRYRSTVNVHAYAATHPAVAALGDALENVIEFAAGTWNALAVKRSFVEGTFDSVDAPRDGSPKFRRVRSLQCVVWHS